MTGKITLSVQDLSQMMEKAAEAGAIKALARCGLQDDNASHDVRDLREILDGFRFAKRTVAKAFFHWLTLAVISLLVLGAYQKLKNGP